jgi:glucose-6-phosphate 1-dehydrogenase
MPTELVVVRNSARDEVVAYQRLLTDAMRGDQTLFVREDAIEESWRAVEGILDDAAPVHAYDPGTWGPAEADRLAASIGGWKNPLA